jgi:tetratricopeptide (TPR) repeat protein
MSTMQGTFDRSEELLGESLELARGMGDQQAAAVALDLSGVVASERGDLDRAVVLFEEGLALAREVGDPRDESEILRNLGIIARRRGEPDQAAVLLREALARSRIAGNSVGITSALVALAAVVRETGDLGGAQRLLAEAADALGEAGDQAIAAEILNESAFQAAAGAWWESAACRLGAAAVLRERLNFPLLPSEREVHERALAAVRTALGEDGFSAAWEGGRALPLEEAMTEARALSGLSLGSNGSLAQAHQDPFRR